MKKYLNNISMFFKTKIVFVSKAIDITIEKITSNILISFIKNSIKKIKDYVYIIKNKNWKNLKRVLFETLLFLLVTIMFIDELYLLLPNPIQLVALKLLLISMGVLHAHIVGKLFIPVIIDWNEKIQNQKGAFYARIGFYVIIPLCYAFGG